MDVEPKRSNNTAIDEQPLVTIGIPTYNRAASGKLKQVITRALEQTYQNLEILVSDNCSADNTSEIVNAFTDPRLQYTRQETNIGANNNFNFCLQQARGEYFLLLHDDDSIDADFIESCIAALDPGQTTGVIYTGMRVIDGNDRVLAENPNRASGLSPLDFVLGWFQGTISLYMCNSLYNTQALKEVGGFHSKHNLFTDLVPTFKLVKNYGRVDVFDIKASFRRHTSNMSYSTPMTMWIEDGVFLLGSLKLLFPDESDVIHQAGNRYFSENMYWRASRRSGTVRRWADYLITYKAFGYCYSPLLYKFPRKYRTIKRLLGQDVSASQH